MNCIQRGMCSHTNRGEVSFSWHEVVSRNSVLLLCMCTHTHERKMENKNMNAQCFLVPSVLILIM
jgi:hypothetical protein